MSRFVWRPDSVFSLRLKDGSFVLGQLLKSPYLVFFQNFRATDQWEEEAAERATPLFFCAVARQFLLYSALNKKPDVRVRVFQHLPHLWIRQFPGSRQVTLWKGTPGERTLMLLSEKPGGQLIENHLEATGFAATPIVKNSIALNDDRTIDSYELDGIGLYPQINERLFLCRQFGRNVDPEKDLLFNRTLNDEYRTYVDMLACRGTPEDWGYSSQRNAGEARKTNKKESRRTRR